MDKLNKRIREFAEENGLYIMGHYNRDQYAKKHADREAAYYSVFTETGITETDIFLGKVQPNCSYEHFLEKIALKAISEAGRLSTLTNELEEERHLIELTADALADKLKEIKGE